MYECEVPIFTKMPRTVASALHYENQVDKRPLQARGQAEVRFDFTIRPCPHSQVDADTDGRGAQKNDRCVTHEAVYLSSGWAVFF
jgi:hypothetical protein